jgi:hypothetical protein
MEEKRMSNPQLDGQTEQDIVFGAVRNNLELANALQALIQELSRACQSGDIDEADEEAAQSYLAQAVREANMPVPCKVALQDHLDSARECLAGSAAAAGIITLLTQASETVQARF